MKKDRFLMANAEETARAVWLLRHVCNCAEALKGIDPDRKAYEFIRQEMLDSRIELLAIVTRADAHNDVDLLAALGVKTIPDSGDRKPERMAA